MTTPADSADPYGDSEISLAELWRMVWPRKFLVAGIAAVFLAGAIVYALLATPVYRAEVVVVEARETAGQGGLSSLAGQLSGLASLAGVNVNTAGNNGREHAAVLRSRNLIEQLVVRNKLQPILSRGASQPLSLWKTVRMVKEQVVDVQEDTRRGTITISVEWTDPRLVAAWANSFVALANETIRDKATLDARRNIAYLEKRINETTSLEVQKLMYSLIENETKTLMLANSRAEYAFSVVDPATVPELRVRPRRTLIAWVGLALGLAVGVIVAFLAGNRARVARTKPRS
jgi:uncharacterized protein involved in exopolysaccharide biosynthesis